MHVLNQQKLWHRPTRNSRKLQKELDMEAGTGAPFKARCINLSKGQEAPGKRLETTEYMNHTIVRMV